MYVFFFFYKRRFVLQGHAFLCRGNPRCGGGVGSKVARGATAAVTKPVRTPPPFRHPYIDVCSSSPPPPLQNCEILARVLREWAGGRTGGRPAVLLVIIIIIIVVILLLLLFCQRPMTRENRERRERREHNSV
uniref:Uncharacterized protein n=1 Tax=Schizaphis graminum TaxID=13262 RepID=A0A2S2N6Z0_SCHGA